ncbi:uncharacterized protein LOC121860061 [Homarus americanus]|uniref:uncharacterized protein LOC121860061 n=1 Tax=Homarus americanus TaxID=6706 RepID=UPI001C46A8BB|nr:uncharacterized protein LOC121860061 [Homarus americanus]
MARVHQLTSVLAVVVMLFVVVEAGNRGYNGYYVQGGRTQLCPTTVKQITTTETVTETTTATKTVTATVKETVKETVTATVTVVRNGAGYGGNSGGRLQYGYKG